MVAMLAILLVAGIVLAVRGQAKSQLLLETGRHSGRLLHLRSGEYPASCSWCKSTTLARKLVVFERTSGGWRAVDLVQRLQHCPDGEVEATARPLVMDHPQFRRMCTERCAKEFFTTEHVPLAEPFTACEYCSARSPASLMRCPNCGALRQATG
jgi:hypothetical protein